MGASTPHQPNGGLFPPPALLAASSFGAIDEAAFRAIVDAVPQMMWVNGADGGVRFFNRFGLAYLGRANAELEGRRWLACLHDDDRDRVFAVRAAAIAEGRGYTVEGRFRRGDGTFRWQRFEVQPVRGTDGVLVAWIGSARDIEDERQRDAERERLLAEVFAQRSLFEAAYAQAPIGLTIAGADGRMVQFNAEAERILGHPMVATGQPADYARYRAEHEDGTPYAAEEYATTRALRGITVRQELMRYRRDDGLRLLRVSGAPVRDAAGTVTHAVCTFVDVTEREAAEHALAEREERLRAALDAARTGTFRWDIRTDALDWDLNLDRLFGLEPGRTARSLDQFIAAVHPDDRARVVAACARCAADGADFDEELRVVWPDGSIHWLHDLGRTYRDADGRPAYMTGACVDITERRRQQDELRALAETMPQLVWMADATGRVDYVNTRWLDYTGYGVADIASGSYPPDAVHRDDMGEMERRWSRAVASGTAFDSTYRLRRRDGAYRWFLARAVPWRDENGTVQRWFGSSTDIHGQMVSRLRQRALNAVTEALAAAGDVEDVARVAVERGMAAMDGFATPVAGSLALLREGERRLELLGATNSPDEINEAWRTFPIDAPVPMAEVARSGVPLFQSRREDVLARYPQLEAEVTRLGIAAAAVLPLAWGGRCHGCLAFLFGEALEFDDELRELLGTIARQAAQAVERALLHELELGARRDAEEARAEAQRANLAKGRFLAMMSHDLRTPINATLGYLDLLAMGIRGPLTDEQAHDLERMRRSQHALLGLVNEVLEYTRIDAGRAEYRRDALPLRDVASDAAAVIAPLAAARGLAFEVDASCHAGVAALGDRDRVRQVLINLLANAVKFTDAGTVRLSCDADDARVRLAVADTGRGIAADRLATVFEPFVQIDAAPASDTRDGVGLGLAIARDLARAMGGDVAVVSEEGRGSTFTVTLPRA